jgi:hypothetical protein
MVGFDIDLRVTHTIILSKNAGSGMVQGCDVKIVFITSTSADEGAITGLGVKV